MRVTLWRHEGKLVTMPVSDIIVVRTISLSMCMVSRESRSSRSSLDMPSGRILGMAATQVRRRSSFGFTPLDKDGGRGVEDHNN